VAENSKIEWCDHTFNPWVGCQKVSPGCDHCYAEGWAKRSGLVQWGPHADRRRTSEANWRKPLKWAKDARGTGKRPKVFCASLADVFDNQVPEEWRADLWALIYKTPELDWLLLTKRPENIAKMCPANNDVANEVRKRIGIDYWPWRNVWLGTTAEDQHHYDRRLPILKQTQAVVHFISYEPAIGPISIVWGKPDWLICGGESGGGARPMDLAWAREARDQCAASGIAYFFKQTTNKGPIPDDLMVRQFPR
jgi:protein gp37